MQRIDEPNLPRVAAGQSISAADWNRIVDRINAGTTATARADLPLRRALRELRVRNDSAGSLGYLSVVAVYGFASPQVDLVAALNDAAVLSVGPPTGAAGEFLATLREPLLPGGVGTATAASGTAFLAEVVFAPNEPVATGALIDGEPVYAWPPFDYATPDAANPGKLAETLSGPLRIVARADSGVCLLSPVGWAILVDGKSVGEIVVQEPLSYDLTDGVLTIKSGIYWDAADGTEIIPADKISGALPNSCHVRAGKGIRFVDGGRCGHGARDGFILQIDAVRDDRTTSVLANLKEGNEIKYGSSLDVEKTEVVEEITMRAANFLTAATLEASGGSVAATRIAAVESTTFVASVATEPENVAKLKSASSEIVAAVETEDVQVSTLLAGAVVKGVVVGIGAGPSGDETSTDGATGSVGTVVSEVAPTDGAALKTIEPKEDAELKPNFPNVEKRGFLRSPQTSVSETAVCGSVVKKTVVKSATLGDFNDLTQVPENAKTTARSYVASVRCVDGDLVVETRYLALIVETEEIETLSGAENFRALTDVTFETENALTALGEPDPLDVLSVLDLIETPVVEKIEVKTGTLETADVPVSFNSSGDDGTTSITTVKSVEKKPLGDFFDEAAVVGSIVAPTANGIAAIDYVEVAPTSYALRTTSAPAATDVSATKTEVVANATLNKSSFKPTIEGERVEVLIPDEEKGENE